MLCLADLFAKALRETAGAEPCGPAFSVLEHKDALAVASFYSSCWKTRAVPQAAWWQAKALM